MDTSLIPAQKPTGDYVPFPAHEDLPPLGLYVLTKQITRCVHGFRTAHLDPFLAGLLNCSFPVVEHLFDIALSQNAGFAACESSDNNLSIRMSILHLHPASIFIVLLGILTEEDSEYYSDHNLHDASPTLAAWLDSKAHSPKVIRVSLGVDAHTFFAVSDQGFRWGGVGDDFHEHVQGWLSGSGGGSGQGQWKLGYEPESALFGVNGGYLITCKGGRHLAWNKKLAQPGGYPSLTGRLMKKAGEIKKQGRSEETWVRRLVLSGFLFLILRFFSISFHISICTRNGYRAGDSMFYPFLCVELRLGWNAKN